MDDRNGRRQYDRGYQQTPSNEAPLHRAPPAGKVACRELHSPEFCSQARSSGLAMKIDEKVPTTIPITRASENPCSTAPPNRNSANAVSSVSPEVRMVRLKV